MIESWYTNLGMTDPESVSMDKLAEALGVEIKEWPYKTVVFCRRKIMLLREGLEDVERREVIAHELAHVILHPGGQAEVSLLLAAKWERQADRLARMLLVPRFLLKQEDVTSSNVIAWICWKFRVTPQLVRRRLDDLRSYFNRSGACRSICKVMQLIIALAAFCDGIDSLIDLLV
jgi:Zn-dependent peptidase ImmA (M78 family)